MKKKGNYNTKNATKSLITCVALNSTKKIIEEKMTKSTDTNANFAINNSRT